jgi:hypothetical protein
MTKQQWQADLEKDWPRLVSFAKSFTPTGWAVIVASFVLLFWMASQWVTFVIFAAGIFVGYHGRGEYEKLNAANKKPVDAAASTTEPKTT